MKQEKRETRSLCPLAGFAECRQERCALWDDDWALCSLSSGSRYSGIRTAVCDAAVEVIGEYGGKRPQSLSVTEREPLGAVIDA